MAGWGVLSGLGKGLENFGNEMSEQARQKAKEELAQKLELEREERAEARQVAREERQAARADATVTEYRPLRGSDGVTWMQGYNASGAPRGERRLANEQEIADFTRSQEENRIKLEDLVTRAEINKFKAGRLKTEAAQDDAEHAANLAYKRAATAAAGRRGMGNKDDDDEATPLSIADVADALLEDNSDLVEQYGLTPSMANDLAASAIRDGRASGQDPKELFRKALPKYVDEMRAKGYLGSKKKGSLELSL